MSENENETAGTDRRCRATTVDGRPCQAKARPGRDWCPWHDSEPAAGLAESRAEGGRAASNDARARKRLRGGRDLAVVMQTVMETLEGVTSGKTEPGVANAVANLARAAVAVAGAADLERRLADLERQAAGARP